MNMHACGGPGLILAVDLANVGFPTWPAVFQLMPVLIAEPQERRTGFGAPTFGGMAQR